MKKKISYVNLLKEAIAEYDTKVMDYKGPLSEPIISFDGKSELKTHADASSILERYYFKEKESDGKLFVEDVQEEEPDIENEIKTGEKADPIKTTMAQLEKEIEEDFELEDFDLTEDDKGEEEEKKGEKEEKKGEKEEEEGEKEEENVTESIEQAVIEKLIQEMEDGPDEGAVKSEEKKAEKDEKDAEKMELTSSEDIDKVVEEVELEIAMMEMEDEAEKEDEEKGEEGEEKGEEGEEDLDVDAKVKKESYGLGPIVPDSDKDLVEEAFRLFKEEIEKDEKSLEKECVEEDDEIGKDELD